MTAKAQQIKKLLALALDPRGNDAECEAAGAKAIVLARAAKISPERLARLLTPVPTPKPTPQPTVTPMPFDLAMQAGIEAAMDTLFDTLKRSYR